MTKKQEIGALIIRIVLGLIFFIHGLDKFLGGIYNTVDYFITLGLPGFLAYLVGVIELVGGLALILGVGTKIVSLFIIGVMLGAIVTVKWKEGFLGGYEFDLALLAMAIYLLINGSHIWKIGKRT
ncbi:DoxX family protein [Alteribacillus sp. JSM 102045]|uniref:DoxX family protein n=1 Tax=Alteribacillus sp. JSM 102045 TaxID=1562101 RepID=UPI0035C11D47